MDYDTPAYSEVVTLTFQRYNRETGEGRSINFVVREPKWDDLLFTVNEFMVSAGFTYSKVALTFDEFGEDNIVFRKES